MNTRKPHRIISILLLTVALTAFSVVAMADDPPEEKAEAAPVFVLVETTMGNFTMELDPVKAPKSVANFMNYVDKGFYDSTIFHRIIDNFMIQGGGFTVDLQKKPVDKPVENEWKNGLKNVKYSIAMARLGGQANSATSQFFINVTDNPFLDQPRDGSAYAVFGKVIDGKDVIDKMKGVKIKVEGGHQNLPVEPIIVTKMSRAEKPEKKK